ncbi:MAG: hypothetical protein MAG451_02011 [Anaerolineales bacterium]|nr:hypothetical protein [Anaerolineales bacterium]
MTTLQIARAKEKYLEDALDLVASVMENGDVLPSLAEDVESLVQDTIDLFATLRRCDEQHSLLAATSEDYPYEEIEVELAALFQQFLALCNELRAVTRMVQDRGHEIKGHQALGEICAHARRLVQDDQTFYESETYRLLAERAQAEYEAGQVEEWPA